MPIYNVLSKDDSFSTKYVCVKQNVYYGASKKVTFLRRLT